MKVSINDIKSLCEKILERIEDKCFEEVDLNFSTYWTIPFKDGQSLHPSDPKVNNLIEELEYLQRLLNTKERPNNKDIYRLSSIIRALALKIENTCKKF